ncbi:SDR family oxidoreductase [Streptomyces sp. NPDC059874]|uniref:SDR family oxidoreductase n=1 Tax=Streptomyces sp. NPDC059874 TaxID=3346983 RepID=UPI00365B8DB0
MNLTGRTILVTGGARGVGRELTRQLVGEGAHVVAVGRDREQLDALAAHHGDRVSTHVLDLADPDPVEAFTDELPERYPRLSVVINNAGVQTLTDFVREDPRALHPVLRREIAVNLDAVITLSTGLLPHLGRQPSAALVNITSGLALAPKPSAPVYCAAKAALRTFTRALRYQCQDAGSNVHVVDAVLPLVDTDMTRGQGSGKISAAQAAQAVINGIHRDKAEIYIGLTRQLRAIMRVSPALGYRVLRHG